MLQLPHHTGLHRLRMMAMKSRLATRRMLRCPSYHIIFTIPRGEFVGKTGGPSQRILSRLIILVYLGHCAALSFLQNIQDLIEGEMRLATVAADVASFPVYEEEVPPVRDEDILACSTTNIHDFEDLVDVFFVSV